MNLLSRVFPDPSSAGKRENAAQQESLPGTGLLRIVVRRILFQNFDEMAAGLRNRDFSTQHNFPCCDLSAIDVCAGIIVWAKRGTLKGNSGEQTTGTRVAQDLRPHV